MSLLHKMHKRDLLDAELRKLDREIEAEVRRYSDRQGYIVRIRPEQARRELSQ